jgi:glycosyltransferase involved in cell wall biosynthesis
MRHGTGHLRLTIGLPTFDGEDYLPACLLNIAEQTYRDFEVLIYDNASSDRTRQIVEEFASKDSRFRYFRQDQNVPPQVNFADVLKAAHTTLFIWRADDDLWSHNYLEKLVAAYDANPHAKLAVSTTIVERADGSHRKTFEFRDFGPGDAARMRQLFHCQASWIYGLFERETLTEIMAVVRTRYQEVWAADYLVIFYYGLKGLIAGTSDAFFVQRTHVVRKPAQGKQQVTHRWKKNYSKVIEQMNFYDEMRGRFFDLAENWIYDETKNVFQRLRWKIFLLNFMGKRLFKWRTIFRRKLLHRIRSAFSNA